MKTNKIRRNPASIPNTRWAAYAVASAATALAGSQSVEAAIHYSGHLGVPFADPDPCQGIVHTFQLDQPGDSFRLLRQPYYCALGQDSFNISGIASDAFRGGQTHFRWYVARLTSGQTISRGHFTHVHHTNYFFGGKMVGTQTSSYGNAKWTEPGYGFIGFRFNNGAGVQYGWARIFMTGYGRANIFKLFDYAYADPGELIRAGQMSSDEQAPVEQSPDEGSLGGLALGAAGLLAWRKRRSRTARLEDA